MITLIIPTMNRSDFLIRALRYYRDLEFQGYIYIGDSSNVEHAERTKRELRSFEGALNIVYREYPGLSNVVCEQQLFDMVFTPYAAWIADDDFLVPSAMEQCMDFLDDHPDYSAAHGVGALISLESGPVYGEVANAGPYKQPVIEAESASQRLIDHFRDYSVDIFSVHRVETWRRMHRDTAMVADKALQSELLTGGLSVIQGKVKELDCLYLVRQVHKQRYLLPDTFDWITSEDWAPSYRCVRDLLADELAQQDGISMDEARQVVKLAFWPYVTGALAKKWQAAGGNGVGTRTRLRAAARGFPGLRRTWRTFRTFLPSREGRMSLPPLLRPTSLYHTDFMPIYRSVTNAPTAMIPEPNAMTFSQEPVQASFPQVPHVSGAPAVLAK